MISDELGVSARIRHCLENNGIHTFEQLRALSDRDLLRLVHFGRKSLPELRLAMEQYARMHDMAIYAPDLFARQLRSIAVQLEAAASMLDAMPKPLHGNGHLVAACAPGALFASNAMRAPRGE